jgi:hypothetical protein
LSTGSQQEFDAIAATPDEQPAIGEFPAEFTGALAASGKLVDGRRRTGGACDRADDRAARGGPVLG